MPISICFIDQSVFWGVIYARVSEGMTSRCRIITPFNQKIGFKIIFYTTVSDFSGQWTQQWKYSLWIKPLKNCVLVIFRDKFHRIIAPEGFVNYFSTWQIALWMLFPSEESALRWNVTWVHSPCEHTYHLLVFPVGGKISWLYTAFRNCKLSMIFSQGTYK